MHTVYKRHTYHYHSVTPQTLIMCSTKILLTLMAHEYCEMYVNKITLSHRNLQYIHIPAVLMYFYSQLCMFALLLCSTSVIFTKRLA